MVLPRLQEDIGQEIIMGRLSMSWFGQIDVSRSFVSTARLDTQAGTIEVLVCMVYEGYDQKDLIL